MSLRVSQWAWQQTPLTRDGNPSQTSTLLLLALADQADDAGATWTGVRKLAAMAKLSVSAAYENVNLLEGQGLLARRQLITPDGRTVPGFVLAVPAADEAEYGTPPVDNPVSGFRRGGMDIPPQRSAESAVAECSKEDPSLSRQRSSARVRADDPRFAVLLDHLAQRVASPRLRRQLERAGKRERELLAAAVAPLLERGWTAAGLAARLSRDAHESIRRFMPWLAQIAAGEITHEPSPLELEAARHAEREAAQAAAIDEAAREVDEQHARAHRDAADDFLAGLPTEQQQALQRLASDITAREFGLGGVFGPAAATATRRHLRRLAWERHSERVAALLPPGVPPPTTDHPTPPDNGPQRALQAVPAGGFTP